MNKNTSSTVFNGNTPQPAEREQETNYENYEANNESEQSRKAISSYLINKTQIELLLNAAKERGLRA